MLHRRDLVAHLLDINPGKVYMDLTKNDPLGEMYGYLPEMASCSGGEIGALNAESFSERVLSHANDVMDKGNTLLGDEELEMLTVLRMNRSFMEFMREHYNHISLQQFRRTVVREMDNIDEE